MRGARVLVTGGAGVVGSHIVDLLVREGAAEVVVFDALVRGRRANLEWALANGPVSIVEGDIRGLERAHVAALGVTIVRGALLAGGGAAVGVALGALLARAFGAHGSAALVAAAAVGWVTPIGAGVLVLSAARRARHGALGVTLGAAAVLVVLSLA